MTRTVSSVAPAARGASAGTRGGGEATALVVSWFGPPGDRLSCLACAGAAELSAGIAVSLPRFPASPLPCGLLRKIAGTIAMAIISRIAQIVRRSMDSDHQVRGRDRTRPDE